MYAYYIDIHIFMHIKILHIYINKYTYYIYYIIDILSLSIYIYILYYIIYNIVLWILYMYIDRIPGMPLKASHFFFSPPQEDEARIYADPEDPAYYGLGTRMARS